MAGHDFHSLTDHISAELAVLEIDALAVAPWVDKTEAAKSKYAFLLREIEQRRSALELFKKYSADDFQFISVTITP